MITRADVTAAVDRIAGRVRRTPVLHDGPGWFKCEFMQGTGSFKLRGAMNRQLSALESGELKPDTGIVVASGGNAGLANAYTAGVLGVPATAYVPETAPAVKVTRLRALGATVVATGAEYADAYQAALKHADETGALVCHAYDQPEVVAGAGTLGVELLSQVDGHVDTILVAAGGGGLMAGIAAAVDGMARVVAVEPVNAPTLHTALASDGPVDIGVSGVAADSLGARRAGAIAYDVAIRTSVHCVLVTDEDLVAARRDLWQNWRIAVEHGAAAGYAAVLSGVYRPAPGERIAIVLCGANTDPSDLS